MRTRDGEERERDGYFDTGSPGSFLSSISGLKKDDLPLDTLVIDQQNPLYQALGNDDLDDGLASCPIQFVQSIQSI